MFNCSKVEGTLVLGREVLVQQYQQHGEGADQGVLRVRQGARGEFPGETTPRHHLLHPPVPGGADRRPPVPRGAHHEPQLTPSLSSLPQ